MVINEAQKSNIGWKLVTDGKDQVYSLEIEESIRMEIFSYGGFVVSIDLWRNGSWHPLTLSYKEYEQYYADVQSLGSAVGPSSNRIKEGKVKGYPHIQLELNDGNNNLHGGNQGFSHIYWSAKAFSYELGKSIQYYEESKTGEVFHDSLLESFDSVIQKMNIASDYFIGIDLFCHRNLDDDGFPGSRNYAIRYALGNKGDFISLTTSQGSEDSLFYPTDHIYWNLGGSADADLRNQHSLYLNTNGFIAVDSTNIPLDNIPTAASFPVDKSRVNVQKLKMSMPNLSLDHAWELQGGGSDPSAERDTKSYSLKHAASLKWENIILDIFCTSDYIQVYDGTYLLEEAGRTGNLSPQTGICLEPGQIPNAPNLKEGAGILRAGELGFNLNHYRISEKS